MLGSAFAVRVSVFAVLVGVALTSCKKTEERREANGATATNQAAPVAPEKTGAPDAKPAKPMLRGSAIPIGPQLVVQPGLGVAPIFFGATPETIQRHMQAPCDELTETRCLYVKQAVDFALENGVLSRVRISRRDHEVPGRPSELFGTFKGIMPPRIMLGLHKHIVLEEFGKPDKSETIDPPGKHGLVARDTYDGVILEYDKLDNGNTVLAAMEVFPSKTAAPRPLPGPAAD